MFMGCLEIKEKYAAKQKQICNYDMLELRSVIKRRKRK